MSYLSLSLDLWISDVLLTASIVRVLDADVEVNPDDSRAGTGRNGCRSNCCSSDLFSYDDDDDDDDDNDNATTTTTVTVMLIITVWTWMIDNIHSIGFYESKGWMEGWREGVR